MREGKAYLIDDARRCEIRGANAGCLHRRAETHGARHTRIGILL